MKIAINAINLPLHNGCNTLALLKMLAGRQPQHQFLLLTGDDTIKTMGSNVTVQQHPVANSILRQRWWLDVKLPAVAKKWKADVLFNIDCASLTMSLPQIMLVTDLLLLHHPKLLSKTAAWAGNYLFPRYAAKATSIITHSEYVKHDLISRYTIPAEKIAVIRKAATPEFKPIQWEEKEAVKDGYADGREYFLFTGGFDPLKNLMNVLKGFSHFKKWQRSNMKLLITGNPAHHPAMAAKLTTYKFKDDVSLLGDVDQQQIARLMAGAYALLQLDIYSGGDSVIPAAMQCATPVISSNIAALTETGGDAVLYANANDPADIGAAMIKLYQDEALRTNLSEAGLQRAALFNLSAEADKCWQLIIACAGTGKK